MNTEYKYDHNKISKLTVTGSGDVRIKFAIGLEEDDVVKLRRNLLKVAQKVIDKNHCHTMRGNVGDVGITMYNNAKTEHHTYYWNDLSGETKNG